MCPKTSDQSDERVLSTLNRDGSRRWLYPRVSPGRFLRWRRVVAYTLIAIYNLIPWIMFNGKPLILLDLPRREFTFFGTTFLPTDTLLLMLFVASLFVAVFLVTALFGRLWCGWACPQSVYLEFVYRPIERLFDGNPDARRRGKAGAIGVMRIAKFVVFFLLSFHLAHTFLAYFVGAENLFAWTLHSPFEHPKSFVIVMAVTGLMMFDFCYFREQMCIVACPYGRFQSVMLDRSSLIISYDEKRGELRGKSSKSRGVSLPQLGDCVDCNLCVTTCPTGIDIREGLQMECIGCAQCIDACDAVMTKVGRPKGLIRYASQEAMESGRRRLVRPRVIIYPAILTLLVGLFLFAMANRAAADVTILRTGSQPYVTLDSGLIANPLRVKIVNRTDLRRTYTLSVEDLDGTSLEGDLTTAIDGAATGLAIVSVIVPPTAFQSGQATVNIVVEDDDGFREERRYRLQGPWRTGGTP